MGQLQVLYANQQFLGQGGGRVQLDTGNINVAHTGKLLYYASSAGYWANCATHVTLYKNGASVRVSGTNYEPMIYGALDVAAGNTVRIATCGAGEYNYAAIYMALIY